MNYSKLFKTIMILILALTLTGNANAQKPDQLTGMSIDTQTLTLDPGDSYTFNPEFTTVAVSGYTPAALQIFSSDERVVHPGEDLNSIVAAGGGEATVYLYSADYAFSSVCTVTVTGEPVSVSAKGDIWTGPSAEELEKIGDPALKAYYEMLDKPEMFDSASALAQSHQFKTLVRVTSGRADSLAEAMRRMGMNPVYAFSLIDTISVTGTPEQYLILLHSENVLRIDEDEVHDSEVQNTMLEGQAETISHFSTAHNLGLDGSGTAIAFLDSGIYPSHEQFTQKQDSSIIYQACFSSEDSSKGTISACRNGKTEDLTSAEVSDRIHNLKDFTHGTHVTAIASGKDGVAPKSNIIAVNIFTEFAETCKDSSGTVMTCYSGGTYTSDQIRGLQYIINLLDQGDKVSVNGQSIQLAAVNMSLGGGRYTNICRDDKREPYLHELLTRGIITPAASGNSGWDDSITSPACTPSAFAVGALENSGNPQVAYYSNHSKLVDILAPGTRIISASGSSNEYQAWTGTSMAAPMVSGSIALIRQMLPDLTGEAVEALMTEMSPQSAVRKKITKPVLDLEAILSTVPYLSSGPDIKVYGGDKLLQIDFPVLPFSTKCSLNIYEGVGDTDLEKGDLVKSFEGKNLKSAKVKGLSNDTPYIVEADCTITLMKETHTVPTSIVYGMPMIQGQGFSVEKDSDSSARLSWYGEEGAGLFAEYGFRADQKTMSAEGEDSCMIEGLTSGEPVYIDLYKSVEKAGKRFLSLPTSKQYVPVGDPAVVNAVAGSGKIWLEFEEEDGLSSRELQVWTTETGAAGELNLISKQKSLSMDVKKYPTDAVITNLKNGVDYAVLYRNVIKIGKTAFYGEWSEIGPITPNTTDFEQISAVTLTAGSRSAELTFTKDLSVDGFLFELKPIVPNKEKVALNVKTDKAQGTYTFSNIDNGVVYKLRIGKYKTDKKAQTYSAYYPYLAEDLSNTQFDNAWAGLVFIPLPEADYEIMPKYENRPFTINVKNSEEADGFTVVIVNGDPGGQSCIKSVPWSEGETTELRLAVEDTARNAIVMLYKDYEGARYYGPASWDGDIANSQFIYDYGPKSVSEYDLFSEPELASSPQIAGKLMPQAFEIIEKAAIFAVEDPVEEEINDPEANDPVEQAVSDPAEEETETAAEEPETAETDMEGEVPSVQDQSGKTKEEQNKVIWYFLGR